MWGGARGQGVGDTGKCWNQTLKQNRQQAGVGGEGRAASGRPQPGSRAHSLAVTRVGETRSGVSACIPRNEGQGCHR